MEGRLGEHLEDKLFFHYPHLDNTAKDYSWIAAPVVIPFMVVVVVVVVVVVIAVVVKAHGHRHPQPSVKDIPSVDMRYVLKCVVTIIKLVVCLKESDLSSPSCLQLASTKNDQLKCFMIKCDCRIYHFE